MNKLFRLLFFLPILYSTIIFSAASSSTSEPMLLAPLEGREALQQDGTVLPLTALIEKKLAWHLMKLDCLPRETSKNNFDPYQFDRETENTIAKQSKCDCSSSFFGGRYFCHTHKCSSCRITPYNSQKSVYKGQRIAYFIGYTPIYEPHYVTEYGPTECPNCKSNYEAFSSQRKHFKQEVRKIRAQEKEALLSLQQWQNSELAKLNALIENHNEKPEEMHRRCVEIATLPVPPAYKYGIARACYLLSGYKKQNGTISKTFNHLSAYKMPICIAEFFRGASIQDILDYGYKLNEYEHDTLTIRLNEIQSFEGLCNAAHINARTLQLLGNNNQPLAQMRIANEQDAQYLKNLHLSLVCITEQDKEISEIIKNGAEIDSDVGLGTPLQIACNRKHNKMTNMLLNYGANPNLPPYYPPIFEAIKTGNIELVEKLLQAKANVNLHDVKHRTPAMMAASRGDTRILKLLINDGIDLTKTDLDGNSIFAHMSYAQTDKATFEEMLDLILPLNPHLNHQNNVGENALMIAIKEDNTDFAQTLIEHEINLNLEDNNGNTALFKTISKNNQQVFQSLISTNQVNLDHQNHDGDTALIDAVKHDRTNLTSALIQAGANLNVQNHQGKTALMVAIENNRTHLAQELIQAGANVNVQDNNGNTALIKATQQRNVNLIQALVTAGANVNVNNNNNDSALDIAARNNPNLMQHLVPWWHWRRHGNELVASGTITAAVGLVAACISWFSE